MKISTTLDRIDHGRMALPAFQRGYVWTRPQVRELFTSLYHRYPVGCLLLWETSEQTDQRGDDSAPAGAIDMLLDGQQRMTSLYGVMRGNPPPFFDGDAKAFTGLHFHLEKEEFAFYQQAKMKSDPLWVSVSDVMKGGISQMAEFAKNSKKDDMPRHLTNISRLLGIADIDMPVDNNIESNFPLEVVVDIFNRVNSGGTKLSSGDLALARICTQLPGMRDEMKSAIKQWQDAGYKFTLDWLLRSVSTVATGEAKFHFLHKKSAAKVQKGLKDAVGKIGVCLDMIGGRLGLDHDRVLFARNAIPVMVYHLDKHGNKAISAKERDKLLFWFLHVGMWGRFSSSIETVINQDIAAINDGGIDGLLDAAKRSRHLQRVSADDFTAPGIGSRFYPVLYFLTRARESLDWMTGNPLRVENLGRNSRLEMHHIFPKAQLKKRGWEKAKINALANFCFLTQGTNINISDKLPEEYMPEIAKQYPGALDSHWIPQDRELWKIANYDDFLAARRELFAEEMNKQLEKLLHGDKRWLDPAEKAKPIVPGGIGDDDERAELEKVNDWIKQRGLATGSIAYEHSQDGEPLVILDLAWPNGMQEGKGKPVALLLDEEAEVFAIANNAQFLCFRSVEELKQYIQKEHPEE